MIRHPSPIPPSLPPRTERSGDPGPGVFHKHIEGAAGTAVANGPGPRIGLRPSGAARRGSVGDFGRVRKCHVFGSAPFATSRHIDRSAPDLIRGAERRYLFGPAQRPRHRAGKISPLPFDRLRAGSPAGRNDELECVRKCHDSSFPAPPASLFEAASPGRTGASRRSAPVPKTPFVHIIFLYRMSSISLRHLRRKSCPVFLSERARAAPRLGRL